MEPWYKVVTPRDEVRRGRSFDPSEFAIALEQVVRGEGPVDYRDPVKFIARTSFTKALREHSRMVLRRLCGETTDSAPVMTLITQFGGGKTHTLTLLYHLVKHAGKLGASDEVAELLRDAGVKSLPKAKVAVFVGGAWDPQDGRETPWMDIAHQLAGDAGVALLGKDPHKAPGTDAIARLIGASGGSCLFLFDEVLNCLNRHRELAEPFHAFVQNLTVAVTGAERSAALISLPRSETEMTPWDQDWQDKLSRVVRRVAKDLIVNDESEISEVIRKRLFESLGKESSRRAVAKAYAAWCFRSRNDLPPEWTAVDRATTDANAQDLLASRFEACYPFHPATLTVFQRKWQSLRQFQQTRGTLAMLAQWVSLALADGYRRARQEPLITLGSAPIDELSFRSAILGQLGEPRLVAAMASDIGATNSHAVALDADASGPLRDIHRRVGVAVLFESSGGQGEKVAHLPDLRFALGEPEVGIASIDNAVLALARKGYYVRKVGSDGYRFGINPTLNKVVSDRRASLDEEEVSRQTLSLIKSQFQRDARLPVVMFPANGTDVPDTSRLTIVVAAPDMTLDASGQTRAILAGWTKTRGTSPRLFPGGLLWCVKKPGRDLHDRVETWLAWKRVAKELNDGTLPHDFDKTERADIATQLREAEEMAQDEVWASYRYLVIADREQADGLQLLDLAAGHAGNHESLSGRVIATLKMESVLNDSVGASYLERRWPPALAQAGAWPLGGLRQAFLSGALTRLLDVDAVLKAKIPEFVASGAFALASGAKGDGTYERVWFSPDAVDPDEIVFESDVFLLKRERARALAAAETTTVKAAVPGISTDAPLTSAVQEVLTPLVEPSTSGEDVVLEIQGQVPPDVWNRLGTRLLPKLRSGALTIEVTMSATVEGQLAEALRREVEQILADLQLKEKLKLRVPSR